jgi:Bacterial Ig-like domain
MNPSLAEGQKSSRKLVLLLFECLLLTTFLGAVASSSAASSFCDSPIVRDYEKPLYMLPAPKPIPRLLPFAPPGLEMRSSRRAGLGIDHPGSVAAVTLHASDRQITLNWTVKVVVARPTEDGSTSIPISVTETQVGSVKPHQPVTILGGLLEGLGSYRIDITFLDQTGNPLDSYFEYVRIVPRSRKAQLTLSRPFVPSGGILRARIENLGTEGVSYGLFYSLEKYQDHGWQRLSDGKSFAPSFHLSAGQAGECQRIRIPKDSKAGLYRIRKKVAFEGKKKIGWKVLSKTFQVQGLRR